MDWIEGAENLQLRCFDRCAFISASHTNSDIFETAICFLLIPACGRGPKPLWRELVRTQFLGSVITGHFEPFTVWSSQLTGMESSVPSWVLTKVFCVMLYSVMHFCVFAFRVMPFWWWPFPCFFPLPWLLALTRYIFLDLTYPLPLSG